MPSARRERQHGDWVESRTAVALALPAVVNIRAGMLDCRAQEEKVLVMDAQRPRGRPVITVATELSKLEGTLQFPLPPFH